MQNLHCSGCLTVSEISKNISNSQRTGGLGGLGEIGERTKQKIKTHRQTTMVITRGKGGWGQVEEGKAGINVDRRRLNFG